MHSPPTRSRAFRRFALAALALAVATPVAAIEGMWMPKQVPRIADRLEAIGIEGPERFEDLTGHPMGAVVSLGFCTASFVSPDGLLVTNHHCATGALQFNSTPESNLLQDGFLARERSEELTCGPGFRVFVTRSIRDVTGDVLGGLDPDLADADRDAAMRRQVAAAVERCETEADRCQVRAFFGGLEYYELAQVELLDVRLVQAPPDGIGVFGGETDNFSWPRHTGDWTFLRAYVGEDGEPAAYAEDNVPYRPRHWLRVAPRGVEPGDPVVVAGYPGRTYRNDTLAEVRDTVEHDLPVRIRIAQEQAALLRALAADDDDLAIKVSNRLRSLDNGLKYRRGVLAGMVQAGAIADKEREDAEFRAWIASDPRRAATYGAVLDELDALGEERAAVRERAVAYRLLFSASDHLEDAYRMYRLAIERGKPDLDRRDGYRERDVDDIRRAQERKQRTLDARIDRVLLRHALDAAARLPRDLRIGPLDAALGLEPEPSPERRDAAIESWLDRAYAGTRLGDLDVRLSLMERSPEEIASLDDPFVRLAVALHPFQVKREAVLDRWSGAESRLRPVMLEALLAMRDGGVAPDANGTLRITFGVVEGASVRDGLAYTPMTTLAGLRAKHTGEGEFDAPDALIRAIDATAGRRATDPRASSAVRDVPVNFLSSVDTTGGNSGSPTLNAEGQWVGLLFDGTWESIAADYVIDAETTRSIHVDVRYLLWVLDRIDGADALLRELGVTRTAGGAG